MTKEEIISLTILALVAVIAFLSTLQVKERRQAALYFSLITLVHTLAWGKYPESGYYYLTAAINDLFIIFVITRLQHTTKMTERLAIICAAFTAVNAASWILWFNHMAPYTPAYIAIFLYVSTIVVLLTWDGEEDGNYQISSWLDRFRVHNYSGAYRHIELSGKD